jgi:hypothetical protein
MVLILQLYSTNFVLCVCVCVWWRIFSNYSKLIFAHLRIVILIMSSCVTYVNVCVCVCV